MTEAETILAMIEKVDPADTAGLDEIDARVTHYLLEYDYPSRLIHSLSKPEDWKSYTCSRDALKSIRPEGWWPMLTRIQDMASRISKGWYCGWFEQGYFHETPELSTEELAELHAIIQAHAHDRSLADKREGV